MRIGVNLPVTPGPWAAQPSTFIGDAAALIEKSGFAGAWVFDALARGRPTPDPLTALTVAATQTETIEVGSCILQVPLRHPVELAHRVLTTQMVAGGRLVLGVGAGSTESDHRAVGSEFAERFTALDRSLRTMRHLWAGHEVGGVRMPTWSECAGAPPVLIGAWAGGRWITRAATDFDGWIASAGKTDWATLESGLRRFRDAGGARAVVVNITADVGGEVSDEDATDLVGPPSLLQERIARFRDVGFDDLVVAVRGFGADRLEELASVISGTREG